MPSGTLHYRFRIRTASDEADLFVATSLGPEGTNPYIESAPSGDGSTLDPLTGKVSVGAYTVKVIDAPGVLYQNAGSAITDGWEYANQAAAESAGWVFTDTMSDGSITVGATDQVHGGSRSLKYTTTGGGGIVFGTSNELKAAKVYDAGDGILANTPYTVTVYGRMDRKDIWDGSTRLIVNGVDNALPGDGSFAAMSVTVNSSETATLNVALRRQHAFVSQAHTIHWDDLSIQGLAPSTTLEGRIVTSSLADLDGRQQLMSKRALVEESTDGGTTWTVIHAGYINRAAMTDALLWEFTVGDSRRVEQSKKVFDQISDPVEHPLFIGTMDRASCLVGGPIIGDWGGIYRDRGRPRFECERTFTDAAGNTYALLGWRNGGGSLHAVYKEDGPPMREHVAEFLTDSAREYVDKDADTGFIDGQSYAPCPGLVARIYDEDTGEWVADQTPMLFRKTALGGFVVGDYILCGQHGGIYVRWNTGTPPSAGEHVRMAIFPRAASERNPIHWEGHPMDLVANCLDLCGIAYDLASAQAVAVALGENLKIHLRITQGDTCQTFLENTVYGPFGVAPRLADDGELEFVLSRSPDTASAVTVTEDNIAGNLTGNPWYLEESSAANRVVIETQAFILDDRRPDSATPFDAVRSAKITTNIKAEDDQEQEIYGDKEVRFTLPGCIQVGDAILGSGTQDNPGGLDLWAAGVAKPMFDWQGRGAIRAELDLTRGVTDARIGDVITLDLAYFPSANPAQSPVSQRGTDARRAVILRRTVKPDRVSLLVEDRGLADTLECAPEFTLTADATFPKTTVEVEVTNEEDLSAPLRVEMAQGASEPTGAGQFVRMWFPNRSENPFDLPAVCAGNTVWVRMRCEENGQVGVWSDWDSIDLDDLTAPSDLVATVSATSVALTWTNGESTYPVEVLARLDSDTTLQSVAVLPAGSTSYTLNLTEASSDYTLGVRYVDPKGCTSATTTVSASTDVQVCLDPPLNPAAFADGAGTYGLEVDAQVVPGGVEIWTATETAVGSGTPGTYTLADTVPALALPLRTRWAVAAPVPNDGLLRYLKAASSLAGYDACGFSAVVSVNPWTVVTPADPVPAGDPTQVVADVPVELVLFGATFPMALTDVPAERTVLDEASAGQTKFPLGSFVSARVVAVVADTDLPDGAIVGAEFENPDVADEWHPIQDDGADSTANGPTLAIDAATVGTDTGRALAGAWIPIRPEAKQDVRLRPVIGGGDGATGCEVTRVVLQLTAAPTNVDAPPDAADPIPPDDPGSCDTPGSLEDWSTYADEAAFLAVWTE